MKHIDSIQVYSPTLHFRQPFKIAYENVTETKIVILKLVDQKGNIGLGSAAPDEEVTGETVERVSAALSSRLSPDFFSFPVKHIYEYHDYLASTFADLPSAQMAVEGALLHLYSQEYSIPLVSLFGGYRDTRNTLMTIGIKNTDDTLEEVKKYVDEGFNIIKIKCGLNSKADVKKIIKVFNSLPQNIQLALDANQGYSFEEAKYVLSNIDHLPIAFFEQPVAASNIEELKKLHKAYKTPIFADESIVGIKDAVKLLTGDYVSGVNVKLMKCGGPINFLRIFHLAKSLDKKIMIGCMYESNISLTTGAALALALPLDYVDLDSGHLDFIDDPTTGGAIIRNGKVKFGKKEITVAL